MAEGKHLCHVDNVAECYEFHLCVLVREGETLQREDRESSKGR